MHALPALAARAGGHGPSARALSPQAVDLAAAACACAELRRAAAADALWKPLFDAEFGDRPPVPGCAPERQARALSPPAPLRAPRKNPPCWCTDSPA